MSTSEYATVLAWQDALNDGDSDTLVELSSDGIEISSAEGGSQGLVALLDWAAESNTTVSLEHAYVSGAVVVTSGEAAGSLAGGPDTDRRPLAIAFRVDNDQVVSVFIHPDVETALTATGLGSGDLVRD
ncbi:nuclear transport factor 2 family protein [Tomitella biformata]|uniref:nuclear transport factor 2 family protein n=1 Tax=Tomitella biformata TaxID=630403 RepID=UPI0004648214|nr:nuclear transport factor 2 family protein [Tomitella biformata]